MRHPFPGPGIAIRVLGEVTPESVEMARKADHIFISQWSERLDSMKRLVKLSPSLRQAKLSALWVTIVYMKNMDLLRAVELTDFMTANPHKFESDFLIKISTSIINEVHGVCRGCP